MIRRRVLRLFRQPLQPFRRLFGYCLEWPRLFRRPRQADWPRFNCRFFCFSLCFSSCFNTLTKNFSFFDDLDRRFNYGFFGFFDNLSNFVNNPLNCSTTFRVLPRPGLDFFDDFIGYCLDWPRFSCGFFDFFDLGADYSGVFNL